MRSRFFQSLFKRWRLDYRFRAFIFTVSGLILMPGVLIAQLEQATSGYPPLAQPLVREGDLAVRLVERLNLGTAVSEAEAESLLISIEIAPKNGWIADYPVTPDVIGELEGAFVEAAEAGALGIGRETALGVLQDVLSEFSLSVEVDTSEQDTGDASAPDYPDSTTERDYYADEGPPVVTYYDPPPDYAYLYTWVSYPFRWRGARFPGFFVKKRFHVWVHGPERGHGEYLSNYFQDPGTGQLFRIDPAKRSHGESVPEIRSMVRSAPLAPVGSAAVTRESQQNSTMGTKKEYRGYGVSGPSAGVQSSTFERSGSSSFERTASDRGFQSRSGAGQISGKVHTGGSSREGSAQSETGAGGFHGGGGFGGGARH
ncbi:MAG TPA: hypothetical protein VEI28_02320 [Thermodesulfovibrionales bacterium]|nr:hypothetical protein [Thermodesulfovibrionales bacterium]